MKRIEKSLYQQQIVSLTNGKNKKKYHVGIKSDNRWVFVKPKLK